MQTIHVVSVSGGKDSAVTLAIAVGRVGRENVRAIYCDTGNEHQAVYDYLDYLDGRKPPEGGGSTIYLRR